MAVVRWTPGREVSDFNRIFGTFFDTPTGSAPRRWAPAVDVVEHADEYLVKADLPGVAEDAVSIEVDGRVLTIAGERSDEHSSEAGGIRRAERLHGSFRRSLTLPRGVEAEKITARHENGVLEIRIPKPQAPAVHRVRINGTGGEEPKEQAEKAPAA